MGCPLGVCVLQVAHKQEHEEAVKWLLSTRCSSSCKVSGAVYRYDELIETEFEELKVHGLRVLGK